MAYDVKMNKWALMLDMARKCLECRGGFRCSKFHASSGRSERSNNIFNPVIVLQLRPIRALPKSYNVV